MRITSLTILMLFLTGVVAAEEPVLPSQFEILQKKYRKGVGVEGVKAAKVRAKYIYNLRKLRSDLTQSGDLEEAEVVEAELLRLGGEVRCLKKLLTSVDWLYTANNGDTSIIVFRRDGTARVSGTTREEWRWTVRGTNSLILTYNDGNGCRFDFVDLDAPLTEGRTIRDHQRRTMSPIPAPRKKGA